MAAHDQPRTQQTVRLDAFRAPTSQPFELPIVVSMSAAAPVSLPMTAEATPSSGGMLLLGMHTPHEPDAHPDAHEASIQSKSTIANALKATVAHADDRASGHEDRDQFEGALLENLAETPPLPGAPLQDIYEVETVLAMRQAENEKREFLIKWKGWGPKWNNWEPEEHILDRRMLRKFNKKRPVVQMAPAVMDCTDGITVQSKRRCAKHATMKARMAAREENEQLDEKEVQFEETSDA